MRLGVTLAEKITTVLVRQKQCRVADRSYVSAILAEKDMAYAHLTDAEEATKMARLMAVDYLVVGTLVDEGSQIAAHTRLLNAKDGQVMATSELKIAKDDDIRSTLVYVQRPSSGGGEIEPLSLSYHIFARRGESDIRTANGGTVRSKDVFKIWLQGSSDCYVYVLLLDSKGKASVLFPHPKIHSGNFLRGGVAYVIPPASQPPGLQWYVFDMNTGLETFYILASYEPIGNMPQLLKEMEKAGPRARDAVTETRRIFTKGMKGEPHRTVSGRFQVRSRGVMLGGGPSEATVHLDDGRSLSAVAEVVRGHTTLCKTISLKHID
jgi:hypothetical protein